MYFPAGLKERVSGPGSIFVIGEAGLSIVLAAIAFGWFGLAVVAAVSVLLFFLEVYREAARLSEANSELTEQVSVAETEKGLLAEAKGENRKLSQKISQWKELSANRPFDLEELLEAAAAQRGVIHAVQHHRTVQQVAESAPVTVFELVDEQVCSASAISDKADVFNEEQVALTPEWCR